MNYVKTIWALLPPVIAIIFALKTKEVYISLLIGIVSGTLLLTNFHLVESLNLLFDTVVNCLSKPSNIGILIFLVMFVCLYYQNILIHPFLVYNILPI